MGKEKTETPFGFCYLCIRYRLAPNSKRETIMSQDIDDQQEIEIEAIGVEVSSQPIELYKVLKIANAVSGGGEAKHVIAEQYVAVNGELETRKRRKLYDGDLIEFNQEYYLVICESPVGSESNVVDAPIKQSTTANKVTSNSKQQKQKKNKQQTKTSQQAKTSQKSLANEPQTKIEKPASESQSTDKGKGRSQIRFF